ncbi:hypothetical protein HNP84_005743 [Thermocatellispora tengchongensis]|uniref:Copper transporter n=1 Tax=Thermocatellispora tengchongensis TaxID=1073253 RepID=A0A840PAG8_9ACTN|nr:copper transporter [Thermocatellispora tengchongensis]MBB5135999.1 hypothetical protein [Thermocatellispora tengchongensis]
MIDFRYHLVSIIAIFLALSVGIVLGATFLQEPAIRLAEQTVVQVRQNNNDLLSQVEELRRTSGETDAFVANATQALVQGDLAGERVLLVEPPGVTPAIRDATQQVLTQSGAAVSGRITLTDKYLDPQQLNLVDQLATAAKPADMTFPAGATAYDKAGALLAAAVVTGDSAEAGRENPAATGVLDAFQKGDLITLSGEPALRATLAVVLAPADPYEGEGADTRNGALIALATALDAADAATVVAGPQTSAAAGGLIAALRDSGEASSVVSGVDTADLPAGRIVVVYALREQLAGDAGQYGLGAGASAFEPAPVPTPTPSASGG